MQLKPNNPNRYRHNMGLYEIKTVSVGNVGIRIIYDKFQKVLCYYYAVVRIVNSDTKVKLALS